MMRITAILFALAIAAPSAIVDRMVATVGRNVITDSAVRRLLRTTAFLARAPLDESRAPWELARDRLIEQALVKEEIRLSRYPLAQPDEIRAAVEQVKTQVGGPEAFRSSLRAYRLTEADLADNLAWQITFARFLNYRFQPAVQVTDEILRRFHATWNPPTGAKPSFEEARDRLEIEYVNRESERLLDQWLREARQQTQIETYELKKQ